VGVVLFDRIRSAMKTPAACPHCGLSAELPHMSDADCFRVVDREIKAAMAHLRSLSKRKSELMRARLQYRKRTRSVRRRPGV
jgi:hypothetical protein